MKKYLPAVFVIFFVFFSCSGNKEEEGAVTLTFWHSFVANTRPALEKLIDKYESENPGVKINELYVPSGDALVQKLITAIQSGTAPDIAWVHSDFLDKLVSADAIYPMSRFIEGPAGYKENELVDFFPQVLDGARWNDTLYALPMEATTLALLYNKDLFEKAGLDTVPPADWEELRRYTDRLIIDEDNDGRPESYGMYIPVFPASGPLSIWMVLQWEPFLWQAGGKFLNESQTEALFHREPGVEALTLWRDLYKKQGWQSSSINHDMAFASQKTAMVIDGPWNLPLYRKIEDFRWGIAPFPAGPETTATYIAGEHLAIFKNTKHPGEAWDFLKWVTSPETQAEFSIESGYLPVRKSTLELPEYKEYLEKDKRLAAFVEQFKIGRPRQNITYHRTEINSAIAEAVENTLIGNREPQEALNEAAEKVNGILRSVR